MESDVRYTIQRLRRLDVPMVKSANWGEGEMDTSVLYLKVPHLQKIQNTHFRDRSAEEAFWSAVDACSYQ